MLKTLLVPCSCVGAEALEEEEKEEEEVEEVEEVENNH